MIDSRSIFLSWEPPVADQQNGILRHYFISLASDAGTETRNITSSQRSLTITGLRSYTEYSCTVRAGTVRVGPPTAALLRTTFEDGMLHIHGIHVVHMLYMYMYVSHFSVDPSVNSYYNDHMICKSKMVYHGALTNFVFK